MKSKKMYQKFAAILLIFTLFASLFSCSLSAAGAVYYEYSHSASALKESYVSDHAGSPEIFNITTETDKVACYDMYEISFQLNAEYKNPFDPDDIKVDGIFTYPSGKVVTVPAFYIEPMKKGDGKVLLTYNPNYYLSTGEPEWRVRFAGDEVGNYSFKLVAEDSKGRKYTSQSKSFSMYNGGNKGWAKISETNPSVVVNSADNSVYYGSGANIAWVRSQFTKDPAHMSYNYFVGQAEGNSNMTRVWICHWAWLEWSPKAGDKSTYSYAGRGYYNQVISCAFDDIVDMCEQAGLRIVVVTEDNDETGNDDDYDGWKYNPYSTYQGGFVSSFDQYYKSQAVREQYKKRLRYIIARWGYSSAVYSINMWNDMSTPSADSISYLKELRDYTHSLTDGWRPFLYSSNINMSANAVLDYTSQSLRTFDGTKPSVTNECYASSDDAYYRDTLRNTIWKELCDGSAGTMIWSHDDVDVIGCWDLFRNVLDFTADIPYASYKFQSGETPVLTATATSSNVALKKALSVRPYGDVSGWGEKATKNYFEIDTGSSGMLLEGYIANLYGVGRNSWRNPPTFVINAPYGGEMVLYVDEFGGGTNTMTTTINGSLVSQRVFSGGRRYTTEEEKYTTVPLVKGENRITLDNTGNDWINVGTVYFILNSDSAAGMITAHTHIAKDAAVVYLENQTYSEVTKSILGKEPVDFKNVSFKVSGLSDGRYALYSYNPDTGKYADSKVVNISGGETTVTVPYVGEDYAVKLLKLKDGESPSAGSRYTQLQLTTRNLSSNSGTTNTPGTNTSSTTSSNTSSDTSSDEPAGNANATVDVSSSAGNNGTKAGGWLIWVIAAVVILAAGAAAFFIIKKKGAVAPSSAEDSVEETEADDTPAEDSVEETETDDTPAEENNE